MKAFTLPPEAENEVRAYLFLRFCRALTVLNIVAWLIIWRTKNPWLGEFAVANYLGVVVFGGLAWKRTTLPFLRRSARNLIAFNTLFVFVVILFIPHNSPGKTSLISLTLIGLVTCFRFVTKFGSDPGTPLSRFDKYFAAVSGAIGAYGLTRLVMKSLDATIAQAILIAGLTLIAVILLATYCRMLRARRRKVVRPRTPDQPTWFDPRSPG